MTKFFPAALLALLLAFSQVFADTVELTDGTTLSGNIIKESDADIVIEIQVSDAIIDARTIERAEISKITKTPADKKAWNSIAKLQLPATAASVKEYLPAVEKLQQFLDQFPSSEFAPQVNTLLTDFKAEMERTRNGDVKLSGEWVPAEEVATRGDEIEAQLLFLEMQQLAIAGNVSAALTRYMQIEDQFAGQPAYPEAVELALVLARRLNARLPGLLVQNKSYMEEFEAGLARSPEREQPRIKAAFEAKQESYETLLDNIRRKRSEFPPLIRESERSLKDVEQALKQVLRKVQGVDIEAMKQSVELVRQVPQKLADGEYEVAADLLEDAKELWNKNELVVVLTQRLSSEQKAAEIAAKEAEKLAEEQAKEAAEAKARAEEAKAQAEAEAKAQEIQTQQALASKSKQAEMPANSASEEKPFFSTIQGAALIAGGIVVLIVLVSVLKNQAAKNKRRDMREA